MILINDLSVSDSDTVGPEESVGRRCKAVACSEFLPPTYIWNFNLSLVWSCDIAKQKDVLHVSSELLIGSPRILNVYVLFAQLKPR
jgi:hypothetical protein